MTDNAEDKIRVLIVDDIAETRENIRKLLQFEPDIEVVGAARSGLEALELAEEVDPDVVIMDINMPDMDGIAATEALLRDVPYTQIVILSVQSDADYMRRAMLAGARDFIPKPPSGDELITTIRSLSERARQQRKQMEKRRAPVAMAPGMGFPGTQRLEGKILVVYSAKGGSGCTMLATNLALGLNSEETPAILVDASLQFGDVGVAMNLQVKNSFADLAARANELESDYVDEILLRHDSGLRVLAAPPRPEMADEVRADEVRQVLQFLRQEYVYIIVDTGSTMDDVTLAVIDSADLLVLMATPEIPAIKDARLVLDLLGVLEFPRERVFFVLNKTERKVGISPEAISDNLKVTVEGDIPLDIKTVATSMNKGVPLLVTDRGSIVARNILELMGNIKQRLVSSGDEEGEEEVERSRLFGR
ncbi:MAG: response regulator [Anaerolineales bacterium]|jgi:pilus assembly protein CpaE